MREKFGDFVIDQSFEPRSGSFGSTYRATHPLFKGKRFAIKVIKNIDGRKKADFISEIEALLTLQFQSEHIVVFSYAGETKEGELYCAMEYCEGGDLNELCAKKGGLKESYVALIGLQVCRALAEAHGQGIVHRDVKPSNMMLGRLRNGDVGVKLIDFGLAKTLDQTLQSGPGVKGTPLFASPEQIRDETLDGRSDIYSLGVSLWYIMLGKKPPPLDFQSRHDVEAEHVNYDRPFRIEGGDRQLAEILEKMMAKKRDERFRTAAEVQKALEGYLRRSVGYPDSPLSCSDLVPEMAMPLSGNPGRAKKPLEKKAATRRSDRLEDVFEIIRKSPIQSSWSQFMVAKRKKEDSLSLLAILDTALFENTEDQYNNEFRHLVDLHLSLLASDRGYPNASLRPLDYYWFSKGESIIELEFSDGVLLQDVVRRHGKFRFSHCLPLLNTLGTLLDSFESNGLPLPSLGEGEILLIPAGKDAGDLFLSRSMPDWPDYRVEVNPLSLPRSVTLKAEEGGIEQTLDSNDLITSQGQGGKTFSASVIFCARVYRLIGGKPVPGVAFQSKYGYSNISGLTEESNNLLRDHICAQSGAGAKCVDILRAICEAEGEAFPSSQEDQFAREEPGERRAPQESRDSQVVDSGSPFRETDFRATASQAPGGTDSSRISNIGASGRNTPPSYPGGDASASISVSAGPQYQSANLPEAVSMGPGEFRNPFTKKRFSIPGTEIRPYRQFVCQETGEIFQLSAQIEPMECLVDVKEPGVVYSPYVAMGAGNRINFIEAEGVDLWHEGERGRCPVSGLQYKLPKGLPLLKAIVYEGEPGKISSPYFPEEENRQAIGPADWIPGSVHSLHGREFVLPSGNALPAPKQVVAVDGFRGVVRSPFDNSEFEVSDEDWKKGQVLVCPGTNLLCRLPDELPERRHVAKICGDGSEGIVINPFSNREQKIPGKDWRADQLIQSSGGQEFYLPSVLPPLRVSEYLLGKPGWVVDPYTGKKIPLHPDEWEPGIRVEREGHGFLILGNLPELKEAEIEECVFDRVGSPYSRKTVSVAKEEWKPGEILRCPETDCLFKLPKNLPRYPGAVGEVNKRTGFVGVVDSPYTEGVEIEVSGDRWNPGELVRCESSGQFFKLPETLPPLVARISKGGAERSVESPYAPGKAMVVAVKDWLPGREIFCEHSKRAFLLPDSFEALSRLKAIIPSGAGLVTVPQTGDEVEIEAEKWRSGETIVVTSSAGVEIELTLPDSLPGIPEASLVADNKVGQVRSPHSKQVIEIQDESDWRTGKVLRCPVSRCLYRMPAKLPEWVCEATVDPERTGETGYVFSPYLPGSDSISVNGSDWKEGNVILCEKSGRRFSLPKLPPLRARIKDGGQGIVECPYTPAKNNEQKIPPEEWKPGNEIVSSKSKGQIFVLPDELPLLIALVSKDRPGFLKSPFESKSEFKVEPDDWIPDHVIRCPWTKNEILTPSEKDLPKPKVAKLVADPDRAGAFCSGVVESPYAKNKKQSIDIHEWKEGGLIRCESSDLLMQLPTREEGFPLWAAVATLDPGVPGNIIDPVSGQSRAVPAWLWERGEVVSVSDDEEKVVQLPRELPPLTAVVFGPGKIQTPYEKIPKVCAIPPGDWVEGKIISCPATGRPLRLPQVLPHLLAELDDTLVGVVYSPYAPKIPIRIGPDHWAPGHDFFCSTTGKPLTLPETLPTIPIAKEIDLERAEVTPPYPKASPMVPMIWAKGARLVCPGTGGFFQLPGDLKNPLGRLPSDSGADPDRTGGLIIDPFNGKEVVVPGEKWSPGESISSASGNVFELPVKLPPLRAKVVSDQPGCLISPYSNAKPFPVDPVGAWVSGAVVKCPYTHREMRLPATLPFDQSEVIAFRERKKQSAKSRLIKVGVAGIALLVVIAAAALLLGRSDGWNLQKEAIDAAKGVARIEKAAEARAVFPKRSDEISALAVEGFTAFEKPPLEGLFANIQTIADFESLEKSIGVLAYGASKEPAEKALKQVSYAKTLWKIAIANEIDSADANTVKERRRIVEAPLKDGFPNLYKTAVAKLDSREAKIAPPPPKVPPTPPVVVKVEEVPKPPVVVPVPVQPVVPVKESKQFKEGEKVVLGDKQELVWAAPGQFKMGTDSDELKKIYEALDASTTNPSPPAPSDEAQHSATLRRGFWLGRTEVTIEQYLEFLNSSPEVLEDWVDTKSPTCPIEKVDEKWRMKKSRETTWGDLKQPIVEISWKGAMAYCAFLNEKYQKELPEGYVFTLPTEAEWEYCARAGTATPLPTGGITFKGFNNSPEVGALAWYQGNSKTEYTTSLDVEFTFEKETEFNFSGTQIVATKPANGWGFADMLGNVSEWCFDFYSKESYASDSVDPAGPAEGERKGAKVLRGGSYYDSPFTCRVAARKSQPMTTTHHWLGFRLALSALDRSKVPAK